MSVLPIRGAQLDVAPGKLRVPVPRPGSVPRAALVNRLRAARELPVATVVAPAGYGKTTLLAQWVERDARPCAWVTVDERDNDPLTLLRYLAAALDQIAPLEPRLLEAVSRPGRSVWTKLVPRLGDALASCPEPPILVLDDVSRIESRESLEVVASLAAGLPPEATLALSGRTQPELPIPTLRADGRLFEVGPELLALNRREAERLLRSTGVDPPADQLTELLERTEGWAAGLYLAAVALQDDGNFGGGVPFAGDDRSVADYLRTEYLTTIPEDRLEFLRRTSILDRLSGPLCDAVLDRTGSARELEELEAASFFLVPLDRRRESYRFHRLFRDLLRHELEVHDPGHVQALHVRAASWFVEHDERPTAVAHWIAAGELERAAELVSELVLPACDRGGIDDAESWLACFDEPQLRRYPAIAILSAWVHLLRGRDAEAVHHLELAEQSADTGPMRDGSASARPWLALVRAALCRDGVRQMTEDAHLAVTGLPETSHWRPMALALRGVAEALGGDLEAADATLQEAGELAVERGAATALAAVIAQRALIAMNLDEHTRAQLLALEARQVGPTAARIGEGALELALCARALLRCGRWDEAHAELTTAETRHTAAALPWLAVQTSIELGRARLTLRDLDRARSAVGAAREVLRRHPDLGVLGDEVAVVSRHVSTDETGVRPGRLTGAELRLLPLLATHLSFREIGAQFFVSRNTVKTQAISVYRKLGVSSRSAAIERATQLGLLHD
ncbi:MAG TPA: LuxR C-terminal-related transcriptional regulator [Gaiellaceae bacterium]|nr:LuxR C-terminal-related transcriptional regulator [Gaiellaceae bacterium]